MTQFIVTNQAPADLSPTHLIRCSGDYEPIEALRRTVVDPLFAPLPGAPAGSTVHIVSTSTNKAGAQTSSQPLTPAEVCDIVVTCLGDTVDPNAEALATNLFSQTLRHHDPKSTLRVTELFIAQGAAKHSLPSPSPTVIYSAASDVIPAAKDLLVDPAGEGDVFTVSVANTFHPRTLGVWFRSSAAFDAFKIWLDAQVNAMSAVLPPETLNLFTQAQGLDLSGLTESLNLRADSGDNNHEQSFARVFVHLLMLYISNAAAAHAAAGGGQAAAATPTVDAGVMAFDLSELFCPTSVVLVNVEAHARATPAKVNREWRIINSALNTPVKVVSNTKLSKLTTLQRNAAKAQVAAARSRPGPAHRAAQVVFRKRPPSQTTVIRDVIRVLSRMKKVNQSQNILRTSKTTFSKPNRRNPDDFNKPGRTSSVAYLPDLHVYIDCSGSISESNYQDAVIMLIKMAKKMNVDLYFNSFSHVLSQEVRLRTANKSVEAIWKEFRRIPKVTGGTDYLQIWEYVNASPRRRREFSLVLTDFEWTPPSHRTCDHPANLYYGPVSGMDWDRMTYWARHFSKSMTHVDPAIHQKLIGLVE